MYCRKSSVVSISTIISDIHWMNLEELFEICLFQVAFHVKTHLQAFLRLKGKRKELESRTHESISDLV